MARKVPKQAKKKLHQRPWSSLTPRERQLREASLDIITNSRKSKKKSVSQLAKEKEIALATVLRHTNGFKKQNGRLVAKKLDRISRVMLINEDGKETSIEIRDSRTASVIGSYHNAIKQFLYNGDTKQLSKFSKKKIRDASGNIHFLETSPNAIIKIRERIEEEPERPEVYSL